MHVIFSMYGAFAAIVLILMSIISIWVVGANIKYKNQDLRTTVTTNAVKFATMATEKSNVKISFNLKVKNWWNSEIDVRRKSIQVPGDAYNSSSVFHQVNTLFKSLLLVGLSKSHKSFKRFTFTIKLMLFPLALNLLWSLMFSVWYSAIGSASLILILMIIELAYMQKHVTKATKLTQAMLSEGVSKHEADVIATYTKYKKLTILIKYMSLFFEPILGAFIKFKEWGRDD